MCDSWCCYYLGTDEKKNKNYEISFITYTPTFTRSFLRTEYNAGSYFTPSMINYVIVKWLIKYFITEENHEHEVRVILFLVIKYANQPFNLFKKCTQLLIVSIVFNSYCWILTKLLGGIQYNFQWWLVNW